MIIGWKSRKLFCHFALIISNFVKNENCNKYHDEMERLLV